MSNPQLQPSEISRVKDMLFGEERRQLSEATARIAALDERLGGDDGLRKSVAAIIAEALREAQAGDHDKLAAALAPLVMAGVRREIMASREELIDAMHPMMGRMMSAYVTHGLRDFFYETDRRLERGLSPRLWSLRLKSALSGVPVRELILRQKNLVKIEELLLLRKGSGLLIDRWQTEPQLGGDGAKGNGVLLSSMLSAISDFAREALSDGKSELRRLDVGKSCIYLSASPAHIIAVKCGGHVTRAAEKKLDREVLATFERYGDALKAQDENGATTGVKRVLPELALRLADALAPEMSDGAMRSGRPVYAAIFFSLVGLTAFASGGHYTLKSFQAAAAQRQIEDFIARRPEFAGLPVTVAPAAQGKGFVVNGVAPSREAAANLGKALGAAAIEEPVTLNLATEVVSSTTHFVEGTVNTVTHVVGGAVNTVNHAVGSTVRTVESVVAATGQTAGAALQTTGAVLEATGETLKVTVKTADGAVRATTGAVTAVAGGASDVVAKTVGVVETLVSGIAKPLTPQAAPPPPSQAAAKARKGKNPPAAASGELGWLKEIDASLKPAAIGPLPAYNSQAAVTEMAARVKGEAAGVRQGPRINHPRAASKGLQDGLTGTVGAVTDTAGNLVTGVTGTAQTVVGGVASTTQTVVGGVGDATRNVVTGVTGATQNIVGGVANTTRTLVEGLSGKK